MAIFLFSLWFSLGAQAAVCPAEQILGEGIVGSRFSTVALGCVVQISPREKPDLRYREFWIDERGRFMVFVSVSADDAAIATGTRSYFLFPRKNVPAIQTRDNGDLALQLPSGQAAVFAKANARMASFPGNFSESNELSLENQGGFELQSFPGIRLDTGWMVGDQAYKNPQGSSVFSDAANRHCTIRNDEFFFYENMYYNEPNLRFPTDPALADFLKGRCPDLDLTPLGV